MTALLTLLPRDALIARDGRPFGDQSGNRMRTLAWPLPSTVAGAIRTLLGCMLSKGFDSEMVRRLKQVASHGPLPTSGGQLFLPAPHDSRTTRRGDCVTLRPEEPRRGGVDLPTGLWPVVPPLAVPLEKFASAPAWWSITKMTEWLLCGGDAPASFFQPAAGFRCSPRVDARTHVRINPWTLAAEPNMLYSTVGLVLDDLVEPGECGNARESALVVRTSVDGDEELAHCLQHVDGLRTVGGERRLLRIVSTVGPAESQMECEPSLSSRLSELRVGDGVRMVLATPAVFSRGWRPGWLDEDNGRVGAPPGVAEKSVRLRLMGVGNQRWEAVSGWSYEEPRGPKPTRRMVPAGGVYFFRIESASPGVFPPLWLHPVSDDEQDRRDGFGLAMWGIWNER